MPLAQSENGKEPVCLARVIVTFFAFSLIKDDIRSNLHYYQEEIKLILRLVHGAVPGFAQ